MVAKGPEVEQAASDDAAEEDLEIDDGAKWGGDLTRYRKDVAGWEEIGLTSRQIGRCTP